MFTTDQLTTILRDWATLIGDEPSLGAQDTGRPWPMARVLRWLSRQGIEAEDSFVLIPRLESDRLNPAEVLALEESTGQAIAELHLALAGYPWPANSYRERLAQTLLGDLLLPPDVAAAFAERRDDMAAAISQLPVQLVHGDLTPENILLRRPARLAGFIDFDHLPLAPRIWDIAKYLSRRLRLRWQQGHEPALNRLDYIGRVIGGYHRTSRLTDAEINALPAGIAAANLIEASYGQQIASGLLERRKLPDHDVVLADTIEAARWHLANYGAVRDAVRALNQATPRSRDHPGCWYGAAWP